MEGKFVLITCHAGRKGNKSITLFRGNLGAKWGG